MIREPVYGMAMVRCPECSTVASLQEYPLLGRWAGRLAAAIAAVWFLALVGGIFASAGAMFGISQAGVEGGSTRFAIHISTKHADWYNNASQQEKATVSQMYGNQRIPTGAHVWIDSTWWGKQDPNALLAEVGGVRGAIDWRNSAAYSWGVLIAIVLGITWSVFLLNVKRYRLFVFALIPIGLAVVFAFMANTSSSQMAFAWAAPGCLLAGQEAAKVLWPWLVAIGLGADLIAICFGLAIGRPLVRRLARLLLPPRMLGSLAFLWIAEGKKPPRARS